MPIRGVITPCPKNTTLVLAVKSVNLPDNGRFGLSLRGIDPKLEPVALYVVQENGYHSYQLFPDDDISNLKIDLQ